jgi:putative two-component system response regulator
MKRKHKVLVIDDDYTVRQSLLFILKDKYYIFCEKGAAEGLDCLSKSQVDVILMDIRMPRMNGLTALKEIKSKHPLVEIIIMTAYADVETVRESIRYGAFDYIIKPFDVHEVHAVVERALHKRALKLSLLSEKNKLFEANLYLEDFLRKARQEIFKTLESNVGALLTTIGAKDGYTYQHSERVRELTGKIAEILKLNLDEILHLKFSAAMHDVGKIRLDGSLLIKNGQLTPEEFTSIKTHAEAGAGLIKDIGFTNDIVSAIKHHHERYDGTGYPSSLSGEAIPYQSRIISIAESMDSMMHSPFRKDLITPDQLIKELENCAGSQFDPEIIKSILSSNLIGRN